jgi:hypothetical protein
VGGMRRGRVILFVGAVGYPKGRASSKWQGLEGIYFGCVFWGIASDGVQYGNVKNRGLRNWSKFPDLLVLGVGILPWLWKLGCAGRMSESTTRGFCNRENVSRKSDEVQSQCH